MHKRASHQKIAALESASARIASIENSIAEFEITLQKLDGKTVDHRSEFLKILQTRKKLNQLEVA